MEKDVVEREEAGGFLSAGNIERFGWGLFLVYLGITLYAEELHRIKDAWDQVSLYGGGFLLVWWIGSRLIGKSLSYWMLAVGTIFVAGWVIDNYNLDLQVWPLIVILLGVALLIKAVTNNRS